MKSGFPMKAMVALVAALGFALAGCSTAQVYAPPKGFDGAVTRAELDYEASVARNDDTGERGMPATANPAVPIQPPYGLVFTKYRAPLGTAPFHIQDPLARPGRASAYRVQVPFLGPLLSFAWGDASVAAACREGDIRNVRHLDYEFLGVLGLFSRFTIIATGDQ